MSNMPPGETVLHVAGNGNVTRVADVIDIIESLELDADGATDAARMLEFLVFVITDASERGEGG